MVRLWRVVWLTLLIGIAGAGGFWFYQQQGVTAQESSTDGFTQVVTVQQGSLSAEVAVVGQLEAIQSEELAFDRLSGTTTLRTLDVAAGNRVEAGQVLATIDPAPYEQALELAQTSLQEAAQNLADLQEPATELALAQADQSVAQAELDLQQALADLAALDDPEDVSDLQAALKSAQDSLALAQIQQPLAEHDGLAKTERDLQYAIDWNQRRYWDVKALISSGQANLEQTQELDTIQQALVDLPAELALVQSQRQVARQSAAAKVASAQASVAAAWEALNEAQGGNDELSRAAAQVAVQKAEVSLQAAQEARAQLEEGPEPAQLSAAENALFKAEQAVIEAQADLDGATLTAPFAGTILQTNSAPGDRIGVNNTILTLANLSELQVVAAVDETTIRQVETGQPVAITFDAFPGQTFSGEVLSVPLQGTLQGGVMVYDVPISLTGAESLSLLVGMTANASISVGQAENALLVPSIAVQSSRGGYQVLVPTLGDSQAVPQTVAVEVGLTNGTYTEIVSGLNPGDQILVQFSTASDSNAFGFPGGGIPGAGFGGQGRPPGNR